MKHHNQSNSGRKGFFDLHFHITVHRWRKSGQDLQQGRILKTEADVEAMGRGCLLNMPAQPIFLSIPRPLGDGTTHNELGPPHRSVIMAMPYSMILWRPCLSGCSLLSDNSSLRQVDIKLASPKGRQTLLWDNRKLVKDLFLRSPIFKFEHPFMLNQPYLSTVADPST